jgi:hypothetical protein
MITRDKANANQFFAEASELGLTSFPRFIRVGKTNMEFELVDLGRDREGDVTAAFYRSVLVPSYRLTVFND